MKKSFLLFAVAAAVMASCSKTDTVEQSPMGAIRFDGAYIGYPTETRAVTELDESLPTFQVFGQYVKDAAPAVQVFNNVPVTKGGDNNWTYTGGLRPWVEGGNYVFAAYAPANALTSPEVDENGYLTLTNYSVYNNQYDLIYAAKKATGQAAGSNTAVQFTFKHLLSIVKVTFKSGFDEGTKLTISDLCVNNIPSTATFTASDETGEGQLGGRWDEPVSNSRQSYPLDEITISGTQTASDEIVVIPQNIPTEDGMTVTISFTVSAIDVNGEVLNSGEPFICNIPTTAITTWNPGYKYNYVAEITPESLELDYIKFSNPSVDVWTSAGQDPELPLQ